MESIKWAPIESMQFESINVDFSEVDSLHGQWLEIKSNVEESNPKAYDRFNEELFRSWAIETGIIEGLYELDRGITETLIERGFVGEYVERNSSNRPTDELIPILRDHRESIDFVNTHIENSRPLDKWFIASLHQVITRNQKTYRALNQFGVFFDKELTGGEFKKLPNNPTRPDGIIHEYCPPEQVESELENLSRWYESHAEGGMHPLVMAAWLHHRFTQIHPFPDGNGRVARALLTWHLVKERLLPIVITRDTRADYIEALEEADGGDLTPLVKLVVRLQTDTIVRAINVRHESDADRTQQGAVSGIDTIEEIVRFIADRFEKKRAERERSLRSVQDIAIELRGYARNVMDESAVRASERLREAIGREIFTNTWLGGPDELNEHYYRLQVLGTARDSGHWVNFQEPRYFVHLTISERQHRRSPKMSLVVSLHNVGRHLTGVMAATSFIQFYYPGSSDRGRDDIEEDSDLDFEVCSAEAFMFTSRDNAFELKSRFESWVTQCFNIAFRRWADAFIEQA